jgi:uncharacterized membrane protein (DUF4010 family)
MGEETLGGYAVALGIGLLIGVERERRPAPHVAGVRTFALVALLGAVAVSLDSGPLLAVAAIGVAAYAAIAHFRDPAGDPGLTTEVALLLAFLLGALALREARLAAALGVLVALLLASRGWLHDFVRERLSDREVLDAILLAASALIVLPLLPNRPIDPYGVINPQIVGRLTVVVLSINAFGYVALRALGARAGLAVAGLLGGFVSSAATIGAMGARARSSSEMLWPAVAGAALSSVATVVQLAAVLAIANCALLVELGVGIIAMGLVAGAYGAAFTYAASRHTSLAEGPALGRAFQPRQALLFAVTVTALLFFAALLAERYGAAGALLGIAIGGFGDAHSASVSAASLASAGALQAGPAALAVLLAVSTNTLTKAVVALTTGGWAFARSVLPGLGLMLAALWAGVWLAR